jgi:gluconate 5-dehydrogenase
VKAHKTFPDIFSLKGEVALITGGGTGIGLAIATCLHAAGAKVVLVGRREAELRAAAHALGENGSYVVHDITKYADAATVVKGIARDHGPVSCLVNNAGIHLK